VTGFVLGLLADRAADGQKFGGQENEQHSTDDRDRKPNRGDLEESQRRFSDGLEKT
jgi:hypothetical protein